MKRHDFNGKKVLITGASTGIGRALAVEFAKRGAVLALNALPDEETLLKELVETLQRDYGTHCLPFPLDLLEPKAPERLYDAVTVSFGTPYALVNNAGIIAYGRACEVSLPIQMDVYRLNLLVPFELTRRFVPDMIREGRGVVFNVVSVSAFQPTPLHAVYGSAKAGLQMLSEAMRMELLGTGVSVCTVNPPYTETALLRSQGFPRRIRWYGLGGGLKTPEWVAKKAIRAFERDKMFSVPGLMPAFTHLFLNRFVPRKIIDRIALFGLQKTRGSPLY